MATQITTALQPLNPFPHRLTVTEDEMVMQGEAFFDQLQQNLQPELSDIIYEMNAVATEVNTNAVNTENNAILANGLANFKGVWSGATTYAKGQSVESITGSKIYYTSKMDGNLNNAVTDTNYWLYNPINDKVNYNFSTLTNKSTPIDADTFIISDSTTSNTSKKLTWANIVATLTTTLATSFKSLSYKATPISVTAWNYSSTTITLTVASHSFIIGDTIEVAGLTTTDTGTGATSTYVPNGVWTVSNTTSTTIVFVANIAPTVTNKSVSSATAKGIVLVNGIYGSLGVGQSWQNLTTTRVAGVTYTNSTGKPIQLEIVVIGTNASITINKGGISTGFANSNSGSWVYVFQIIPNNTTYSLTIVAGSLNSWNELR